MWARSRVTGSRATCARPTKQSLLRFSTAPKAYPLDTIEDRTIQKLAATPLHPLTLADLVKNGRPPLSMPALYQSANFSLSILPSRLAHRIQSLRSLPFIVATNPHIAQIHNNYIHSLSTLLPFSKRQIETPEDEEEFTRVMAGLVQTHANTIPTLARGFLESRKYISAAQVTQFLDEHLRARIGTRLIAEQHIALHDDSHPNESEGRIHPSYIGVIDTSLKPASIVRHVEAFVSDICELRYGVRPTIEIDGEPETEIAYIPVHLEYILTELLKNAFRATIESGNERKPIQITIAPAPADFLARTEGVSSEDQGKRSAASPIIKPLDKSTPGVTIRIRDQGGGISPENYASIWDYSFTTANGNGPAETVGGGLEALNLISEASAGGSTIAGLGYGLPLSRAYAEYFGGGIAVQTLWSWGTDVYLSLRGVGKID